MSKIWPVIAFALSLLPGLAQAQGYGGQIQPIPGIDRGWTPVVFPALSTTVESIKATKGKLGNYMCYNPNAVSVVVEFFDANTVVLGTTPVYDFVEIPATAGANLDLGMGDNFPVGISVATVTVLGGSTAPTTGVDCKFGYN